MREIIVGKIYKHFKGHIYKVIAIAKDSENLQKIVVYKNIENNEYWVRAYDEFNSLVDIKKYPEVTQKYRFEEIENDDNDIKESMKIKNLSKYACTYEKGIRLHSDEDDIRPSFYRDTDRILYSLAYTRFLDKTQVFTHKGNDHLSRRMTHVQFVSKIARTIGRALNLNEDLIEAASLGHDLGHTPFGHVGEKILNDISLENNEGYFNHNIHSVRLLTKIENYGKGLNITIPVLDAIMCHNGEFALGEYHPKDKSLDEFFEEYELSYKDKEILKKLKPMTLEGCVVRISDLIAYLGRDIEDGIRLNLVSFEDVPESITKVLGTSNKEIVNTIILDIINNSKDKDYIKLSDDVFHAIVDLKSFNYKNIYDKAYTKEELNELKCMFRSLFNKYLNDLKNRNYDSVIYKSYLNNMSEEYKNNTNERIVIDYLAGMTDDYIMKQYKEFKQVK